jgi:hypothetical protein
MPDKNEFIIFVLLCIISLGLGYWYGTPDKPSEEMAEAGAPPAPSTITNVVTNILRGGANIVAANPQPTPVKPRPTADTSQTTAHSRHQSNHGPHPHQSNHGPHPHQSNHGPHPHQSNHGPHPHQPSQVPHLPILFLPISRTPSLRRQFSMPQVNPLANSPSRI